MRDWNKKWITPTPLCGAMFSAYLWGIETRLRYCKDGRCWQFSAYLWGIETGVGDVEMIERILRFQHTYEGLKLHTSEWWAELAGVFSIPMRDWNTDTGSEVLCSICCFQHTYEGLKLGNRRQIVFIGAGFQHTYEGLKHQVFQNERKGAMKSFQHTYEGLKLIYLAGVIGNND